MTGVGREGHFGSGQGPHATGGSEVTTEFDVATLFGKGGENLCRDREFSVATELATIESPITHDRAGRTKAGAQCT